MQSLCTKKFLTAGLSLAVLAGKAAAADLPVKAPPQQPAYDWTGFYLGGHLGYAWGNSSWTTTGAAGKFSLAEPIDVFSETGSFYAGLQAGYNYMLPNRYVIGVEGDVSFPSFHNLSGISMRIDTVLLFADTAKQTSDGHSDPLRPMAQSSAPRFWSVTQPSITKIARAATFMGVRVSVSLPTTAAK